MTAPYTPPFVSIDFETCSAADLKRTGVHTYAEHPSTRVLCMAWAFNDEPVEVWRIGQPFPQRVLDHVVNMGEVRAWNAAFEITIWNKVLLNQIMPGATPAWRDANCLSVAQVRDTMAQAAYYGLPLSLDMAGAAAGVRFQKDKEGHSLMLRMCRPRSVDPVSGVATWWHETDPDKFDRLCEYCAGDVEVERAVARTLPDLPARELAVWQLDQRMNTFGVGVDYDFVDAMKGLALDAAADVNAQIERLTRGRVRTVTSTAALLGVLQELGYPHDNLRKGTVAERLEELEALGADTLERDLLELRADGAKTSAAKLDAMLTASTVRTGVGRVRGMLQYYGAFRTGRWAGRLIQLQNMPRGTLGKGALPHAIQLVARRTPLPVVELMFGSALAVVSSLLRSCIVAPPGRKLVVADFAQIEARVLPWLADEQAVLDVFRSGGDVYVQAAAPIFGRMFPPGHKFVKEDIPDDERQIGKVSVLALGFGGGKGAFQTMAAAYGVKVSDAEADQIKDKWRAANPNIVQLWWDLDAACRRAIRAGGGHVEQVGRFLKVGMWGPHLVIVLPSGRGLFYRDARLEIEDGRESITYMGVNQYTRKWERIRTYGGKLAENVTQATARDVMAEAMLRLDREHRDLNLILTVHDELLGEADDDVADAKLAAMEAVMGEAPPWAQGLPVGSDGWVGQRYRK